MGGQFTAIKLKQGKEVSFKVLVQKNTNFSRPKTNTYQAF